MPTIDSNRWVRDRIRFLEGALSTETDDQRRAAIEAELAELRASSNKGWRRWLWPSRLPHQH